MSAEKKKLSSHREEFANKIGFDAYGATADMPDPVADAINHMLDHIHLMDQQLEAIKAVLKESGVDCNATPIPELSDCQLKSGEET